MMGVYFAMTGFGSKLAGLLGEWSESLGEYTIFTGIAVFCLILGFLVMSIRKRLEVLTHGVEDDEHEIHDETEGFELADN
jgi:POT family proton-dependent oligopeptide transporter